MLMEVFAKATKAKKVVEDKKTKKKKPKKKMSENLVDDPKKKRALEILIGVLKRKNLSLELIKKSLWKLDAVALSENTVDSLMEVLPNSREVERIHAFTGEESALNKPSQFFWALRHVPNPLI